MLKRTTVVITAVALLLSVVTGFSPAIAAKEVPPVVDAADVGATVGDVTVEAYGITEPEVAGRYLSLHKGDVLTRLAVQRDFTNLSMLAGLRTRLQIRHQPGSRAVSLHWIVLAPLFAVTDHPFYGDQPLTIPIEGFGSIVTSPPVDKSGAALSTYTQIALRAQLARAVYTKPLWVDPLEGREGDLIVNYLAARGDFRATDPVTEEVYSWVQGPEVLYLLHGTNGTQLEFGLRSNRATSAKPAYIAAPSLVDTFYTPTRTTALEAGFSHTCPIAPTQWYPPFCRAQYRVEAFDSIGGLGANTEYRLLTADLAQYNRIGSSTLALHAATSRTGGVLPTSNLVCAYTFGFAKATCGTDSNIFQTEFRIADARPGPLKVILFTETASARVRGATLYAPPTFAWRADSGVGLQYRGFRFNLAYGNQGGRITYEVQGQLF